MIDQCPELVKLTGHKSFFMFTGYNMVDQAEAREAMDCK